MSKQIFLPSDNLETSVMIGYLQALLDVCPSIKCSSVEADDELRGFKIEITESNKDLVLKEGRITVNDQPVLIYPSKTLLWVSTKKKENNSFRDYVTQIMNEKLGMRVLGCESEDSKQWSIEIDLPEPAVDITQMESVLTSIKQSPLFGATVKILCMRCKKPGHSYLKCGESSSSIAVENRESSDDSNTTPADSNKTPFRSHISKTKFSGILEPTDRYAEKIGEEIVLKERQEQDQIETSKNGSPSKQKKTMLEYFSKKSKKGNGGEQKRDNTQTQNPSANNGSDNRDNIGDLAIKEETNDSVLQEGADTSNTIFSENKTDDGDDDDDVVVLENERSPPQAASWDLNFLKTESFMSGEASRSPPTSSMNDELPSPRPGQKRAKPTSRVEDTEKLSKTLHSCINHACETVKVLEREKLDAFFHHVKKKSNPLRIALNYTSDTDGLKQQLQVILDRYYSTPQIGTKEDASFIKWLTGLVERFEGKIPRKRKPTGGSSGQPPSKK